MKNKMDRILKNYDEYNEDIKDQFKEVWSTECIHRKALERTIKKIIIEDTYGQDLTKQEVLEDLGNKIKIKFLLDRLFVEDLSMFVVEEFIKKMNNESNIDKMLNIHKKYPLKNCVQVILSIHENK